MKYGNATAQVSHGAAGDPSDEGSITVDERVSDENNHGTWVERCSTRHSDRDSSGIYYPKQNTNCQSPQPQQEQQQQFVVDESKSSRSLGFYLANSRHENVVSASYTDR